MCVHIHTIAIMISVFYRFLDIVPNQYSLLLGFSNIVSLAVTKDSLLGYRKMK